MAVSVVGCSLSGGLAEGCRWGWREGEREVRELLEVGGVERMGHGWVGG